jgi:hypothetical protein
MKGLWIGCLATAVVFAVGGAMAGLLIVETGAYNTAATSPHMPVTVWAFHTTMLRSVARQSTGLKQPTITGPQLLAGVRQYEQDCALCHGGPAVDRSPWVIGMNPTPPYLLDVSRQMTPGQLYWVIANGVKMTGMPAWGETRSPDQLWSLVAVLDAMPYLPPRSYLKIRAAVVPEPAQARGVLQGDQHHSGRIP